MQLGLCDFVLSVRSTPKSNILHNAATNSLIQSEQKNRFICRGNSFVDRLIQTLYCFPPHLHFESEKSKHLNNALPQRKTGHKYRLVGIRLPLIISFESPESLGCDALPRKVLEMYSDTWLPERLISERCVSSRFSILLNWEGKSTHTKMAFFSMLLQINTALSQASPQTRC